MRRNNFQSKRLSVRNSDILALRQRGYFFGTKIGKGTYATVIASEYADENNKRITLACKIVDKEKAPKEFLDKFFPRELEIITKIEHPNIIQIHSIIQRGPKIFIFMRYAEMGDLLEYIKKYGCVKESHARIWFKQMVDGIIYLHSLNIAHRDLKCENVLLSKRMNIKLADYGFARYCSDCRGNGILSQTYCGSAAYAAPEVVSGLPYNPKIADIWSLGVILFIMLNASMPFDDANLFKLLKDQQNKKYQFKEKILGKISHQCQSLVGFLLEPDVMFRFTLENIINSHWLTQERTIENASSKAIKLINKEQQVQSEQLDEALQSKSN